LTQRAFALQVNIPKQKKAFCAAKQCRKHQLHKVTQYKAGKAKLYVQGMASASHRAMSM
jgi:ribosomal protein L44E